MHSFVADGQKEARLSSRVNTSELLINVVIKAGRLQRNTPEPKWYVAGCLTPELGHVDTSATGGKAGPNLFALLAWNWVSPYLLPTKLRGQADRKKSRWKCG